MTPNKRHQRARKRHYKCIHWDHFSAKSSTFEGIKLPCIELQGRSSNVIVGAHFG